MYKIKLIIKNDRYICCLKTHKYIFVFINNKYIDVFYIIIIYFK